jgi:hypothetical protein
MRLRHSLLLPLLSSFAACWGPRHFTPREYVNGTAPSGEPAAIYVVPAADATQPALGEVRVWSAGARARYGDGDDDGEIVELTVGFELENTSQDALQLDLGSLCCDDLTIDGLLQAPLEPVAVQGGGYAAPGTTERVDVTFRPAADVPRDIDGFAVRFQVRAGDRIALRQVTPFGPRVLAAADQPDPYWGAFSPWGPGFGWGLGFGYSLRCR